MTIDKATGITIPPCLESAMKSGNNNEVKPRYQLKLITGDILLFSGCEIVGKDWIYIKDDSRDSDYEVRLSHIVWVQDKG